MTWVMGHEIAEKELHRKFYEHMFKRITNKHGYVRLHTFYFYVEEGLPKNKVYIWIYQNKLRAEYNNELMIEYECFYDEKNRKIQKLTKPTIQEHQYTSKQLKLFDFNVAKIVKIGNTRLNRPTKVIQQLLPFEAISA